ncbi:MAG: HypC/HybG/HupF family hydrogenase formation chaperone [Verrucomicrobiae bacterium]|nr:HypC/HybG/HupF family hydrogenase formation chaperone [Verrucomicrobiae bacterium]
MCLAVPGKVLDVRGEAPLTRVGRVDFGGVAREVSLAYVPEAKPGDYVIVHVGFALSVVDEAEAARTLAYFKELGEIEEELGIVENSSGG